MNHLAGVDLVLDELDRLAVGLGTLPAPGGHLADHLDVAPVDFDVGDVRRVEAQLEDAVLIVERKIRYDIGLVVVLPVAVQVAGFGRQADDLLDRVPELVLADAQPRHQLFVMLLRELVEIAGQYFHGQFLCLAVLGHGMHLEQQAFLQITRPDARGLQFVDDFQYAFQFLLGRLDSEAERDIVRDRAQAAPQVSVVVDAADQVLPRGSSRAERGS